ncbi:MAG: TIGR03560 family F420-dependent LLM class oxidoreductase [Chloroflexota bacterium]
MTRPLRFGIKTLQQNSSFEEILPCWQEAEQLGFDTAWLFDHFIPINNATPDGPCDEGWIFLSALLARTERIRGGLMVSGNTYRHPAVLANMAATADQLSGGRLEFGLGAGWHETEHAMYGIPLPSAGERMRRLDEACRVLKLLWTERQATFDGRYYQLAGAWCEPKPVQRPYPHFVIGAAGDKLGLRIVAEQADEWNFVGGPVDDYRAKVETLERHLATVGRDPASLERSVQFRAGSLSTASAATAKAYVELGADHLVLSLSQPFRPAEVGWMWREIVPAIRDAAGR